MDPIQPVGAMIQPPNPQTGINAYSGILGLQQQKQELRTQTAQANIAQQNAKENQGIAQLLSDPKNLLDDQGNPLPDAQARIMRVAPTTGSQKYQQVMDAAKAKVGFQSDLANLSDKIRGQVGSVLSADAAGNATREETIAHLTQLSQDNPQTSPVIIRTIAHLPPEPHMTGDKQQDQQALQQHMQQLNQYRIGFGRAVTGPAGAAGYNDVSTTPVSTGGQTNILQTTRAGNTNLAGSLTNTLAPPDQPGNAERIAAARQTGSSSAGNDEALYNQIAQGATRTGQIKSLSGEVQQLAQEVKTGKYSKEGAALWTAIAQRVPGFSNVDLTEATRRQLLGKYTQQLMLQAEQANGASTDAAQDHVRAAMPDPDHMTPDAIVDAARYVSGQAGVASARFQLANKHRDAQGGNSQGLRSLDSEFMSKADPRAFVYQSLPAGEQRRQYLRDHPDFKNQLMTRLHQQQTAQQ